MPHTPTDCARHLLGVFSRFDCRADECLRQNSFMGPFSERGWRADDYSAGLELCLRNDWVRIGPNGGICVTQGALDEIDA